MQGSLGEEFAMVSDQYFTSRINPNCVSIRKRVERMTQTQKKCSIIDRRKVNKAILRVQSCNSIP